MTEKEYFSTLTAEQWFDRVEWLYHDYGKRYTDTRDAILDFLDSEYTVRKPLIMPVFGIDSTVDVYRCPLCYTYLNPKHEAKCRRCHTDIDWSEI